MKNIVNLSSLSIQLTFLSASFSGNNCATPDGEVIVFMFALVDGFVLKQTILFHVRFPRGTRCASNSLNSSAVRENLLAQ